MPDAIRNLMEKIDARVMRERVLIFLTILAVIFLLWTLLIQDRFDKAAAALDSEAQQIVHERTASESRLMELTTLMASDPAVVRKSEIQALNQRIGEIEQKLSGLSRGLISAVLLPKALEDVLQKATMIKVLQVRTLPVSELKVTSAANPAATDAVQDAGTGVFKHEVLIRVSGNYQQLVQLMTQIEGLTWRFYWESLDYEVTSYPDAVINIRVFTLSSEEGLLGV